MSDKDNGKVVLHSTQLGAWQLDTVPSGSIEHHMPLTRDGLPERLQGLFWMNQWGFEEPSDTGTMECLAQSSPAFDRENKPCPAQPDIVVSFAGMPFEQVGDNYETIVSIIPNDVPTWGWFGAMAQNFPKTFDPTGPPNAYKFVFNSDLSVGEIIPATTSGLSDDLRYLMVYEGANTWARRSYLTPDMAGKPLVYPLHRIVDGAGCRLPKYDSYLRFANHPDVAGAVNPGAVALFRRSPPTDNSLVISAMPTDDRWPAWGDTPQFGPKE